MRDRQILTEILSTLTRVGEGDNHREMEVWVKEFRGPLSSYSFSLISGNGSHLVSYQNGDALVTDGHRSRTGLWFADVCVARSIRFRFSGMRSAERIRKYVRGLGYIARDYGMTQTVQFMVPGQGKFVCFLRGQEEVEVEIDTTQSRAWPSTATGGENSIAVRKGRADVSGSMLPVSIHTTGTVEARGNTVRVMLGPGENRITVSLLGDYRDGDLLSTLAYHSRVRDNCVLRSGDFRFDKVFLWAKHDMLEMFNTTPAGSGFFAGYPVFSWFFGRDGLWISMAAMAAGLEREALEHLRLLFSHSDRGRIPHEIPITGDGDPSFEIGKKKIGTMYMSVDSSPLWVLAYARYVFWTGEHPMGEELLEVSRFLASLDSDSDGLIENRFSEGLIGWPESWADRRDGKCVDANAWYTEARRLLWGMGVSGEVDMRKVRDTFWDGSVFLDSIGEGKRRILSSSTVVPCMYMECEECRRFLDFMAGEHMLTPWGMRSMSTTDPMYDGGYHTGTVWPLMSGWLSLALFRNGMRDRGLEALKTFVDAAFSSDDPGRINETYSASEFVPTGQFAQGWSSSLFVQSVIEGLFGLTPDPWLGLQDALTGRLPEGWPSGRATIGNINYRGTRYTIVLGKDGARLEEEAAWQERSR